MKLLNAMIIAAALVATLLALPSQAQSRTDARQQNHEEKLATVPGLSQAQRDTIVRIERENREAQRALMQKTRSEHENLRNEATTKLRAALGDKAYADYVTWKLEQRKGHRDWAKHGDRHGRRGQHKGDHRSSSDSAMQPASAD